MSPAVSALIATCVTPANASSIEEACQAQLCLASANGESSDFLAVLGKLHQARGVAISPVVFGFVRVV